jgi:hypothetical protein
LVACGIQQTGEGRGQIQQRIDGSSGMTDAPFFQ